MKQRTRITPLLRNQRGFNLVEALVVLTILTILALLTATAFDGARTKAQAMIQLAKQVGEANIQLKLDTGCYVKNAQALFDPVAAAVPANNYCSRTFGSSWTRPYMAKYPTDGSGKIRVDKIGAEVLVSFPATPQVVTVGGTPWKRYYVHYENVPNDVIRLALNECNGTDDPTKLGDFSSDKCRTSTNPAGDGSGDFDVLFDETR
jgi:prepilin-type N-terminal cleavage/methylation domain-containing protein